MENVDHCSAILRERVPLREDEEGVYSLLDGRNQKVILAIQFYLPEPGEDTRAHYGFCEDLGAASTLLSFDDFKDQFGSLDEAYELGLARICAFARFINAGL